MSEAVVDDIVAVLPPLLQSLEALAFIARHLNPPQFDKVMEAAGEPDQALPAVRGSTIGRNNSPASRPRSRPPATRRSGHSQACARYSAATAIWSRCFAR